MAHCCVVFCTNDIRYKERDSIMFDTHSIADIHLFLSLVSGGLGLPLNVCLNGQDFMANNTDLSSWCRL